MVIGLWMDIWRSSYEIIFSEIGKTHIIEATTLVIYLLYIYFFLNTEFKN